ncbi:MULTISPECIES: Crp/Fnr family transcriptional regulator [Flavobacterium]|uniref:Crp/Fnr family transcriptional regulator n=1 Tax=Flavobacterium TaxID=237 RepID=UPI0011839F13|nr:MULTISPECIES: Crp/Fnr family transcriptional regulator [Flavobacterium]MCR4032154.1 Crp/Fnr family transcriptional regulator [Flavobacterium panacis]
MEKDVKEQIRLLMLSYIELDDSEWRYCSSMLKVKKVHKKEIVLTQNTICRNIYFVVEGLLRVYFIDQFGKENTFHFAAENTFGTDYESFLKQSPAHYAIQALEDTIVVEISLEMHENLYKKLRYGERLGRLIAEDYFFIFNDKIKAIYGQTPLQRYNAMNEKFPKILQRVSQHHIASYLNITSVHLSRLKNSSTLL